MFTRIQILNSISVFVKIEMVCVALATVMLVFGVSTWLMGYDFFTFWVIFAICMWGAKVAEFMESSEERREFNESLENPPTYLRRQDD